MTTTKKSGRRRLKQMQGLLLLSRLNDTPARRQPKLKPQRVAVLLQPQLLQLAYSLPADQDMLQPLGRIDLRDAKLEQVPDGFIIYEADNGLHKQIKLHDKDKAITDAWFFAVYTAITEYERLPISTSEDVGHKFSAVLTSSMRDEYTETMEFELSCQLMLPTRPIDKPSIKWKIWKTFAELQAFDDEVRVSFGAHMTQIALPRDRKRYSLFRGMRKKSLQELQEQQLALYVEQVFQMPAISSEPVLVGKIKHFLGFDSFFEIVASPLSESDGNDNELSEASASANHQSESCLSVFADAVASTPLSEPPLSNESQGLSQPAAEPVSSDSDAPSSQYLSTEHVGMPAALLTRKSSVVLKDEGEDFVDVIPETDPKAAKKLHKKIIQTVLELVANEERVQDFQDQTKDFGRGKMSAMEYCAFLLGAVGAQECCKLIQEMARLLPDEEKRDELMQARAAIWRRTHRRHRRRSKQVSESVVMEKQKGEQQLVASAPSKTRAKSESLNTSNWDSERIRSLPLSRRNSVAEKSMPAHDSVFRVQTSKSVLSNPTPRVGLADPQRHLTGRASFNTFFGETLQTNPIKEENPVENESDGDSDDSFFDRSHTVSRDYLSTERKLSLNENAWTSKRMDLGRHNSSFLDDGDEDESTDEDEENHHLSRSRHSRHYQQSGSSSGSLEKRAGKGRPLSCRGLTRTRSRQSSSFIEESGKECNEGEEENSQTRFRRSQRRASRKFDEEAKCGPVPEEENPVLTRLKKQGAVNFMMQLH